MNQSILSKHQTNLKYFIVTNHKFHTARGSNSGRLHAHECENMKK